MSQTNSGFGPQGGGSKLFPKIVNQPEMFDDFIGKLVNWNTLLIGAGSSLNYNNAISGHPGNAFNKSYWQLNTTSANNTGGGLALSNSTTASNQSQATFLGESAIRMEASYMMRVAGGVAFGTNGFQSVFGLTSDNTFGTITNGIYVIGDLGINANYVFRCTRSGVTTTLVTGVAVGNMIDRKIRIEVNTAGTSAECFIDDVSQGTIITNLPLTTTILIPSIVCRRTNGAGGLACTTYIDWIYFKYVYNTAKI